MKRVLVIGCGRVGHALAEDLNLDPGLDVTVADVDRGRLEAFSGKTTNLPPTWVEDARKHLEGHDIVVNAVPGHVGFRVLESAIDVSKDAVDISFFPQEARLLDLLAKERGVVAAVDCGVAPGLWNMVLGRVESSSLETTSVSCYVGGLPVQRRWPFEYKAGFSPRDVIEEYTRPARYLVDGVVVTKPALSEARLIDLPGVGTLEAFNTDGLRTLLEGMKTPNIREFTLRYPGHVELMRVFREVGLFSKEGIVVPSNHDHRGKPGGVARVCPLDVTAKLLFPMWSFGEGEEDLTVMRIVIDGRDEDAVVRHTYDLLDRARDGVMSMSRTTGYTASGVVRAVARGMLPGPGIYAPEQIGAQADCYEFIIEHLRERGIEFSCRED